MRVITLSVLLAMASPVVAQEEPPGMWAPFLGASSGDLAGSGWRQVGAIALPVALEGQREVITFWEGDFEGTPVTARCFTTFSDTLVLGLDWCERPVLQVVTDAPVVEPD